MIISVKRISHCLISALLLALAPLGWALTPVEVAKIRPSDVASFGYSVAVDGDKALIAGRDDSGDEPTGSAYIYTRSAGRWAEQAKLTVTGAPNDVWLEWSVALDGDTAVIGARGVGDSGRASGAAYVFTRDAGVWTQQVKLTASDAASGDYFGYSVAVDGDTVVIGAWGDDDNGQLASGAAYVFIRNAGVWTQQAKLAAGDAARLAYFGWSVAVKGDTALIGAAGDDDEGPRSGSAYVFTRSAGVWAEQAKLTASDAAVDDWFGFSVALDGESALVGSRQSGDGAAYVFTREGSVWAEQARLTGSDASPGGYFGRSVAIQGDTVLVGAAQDNNDGQSWTGAAYVFIRNRGTWIEEARLTARIPVAGDWFGYSVALDADKALIGAWKSYYNDRMDTSAAYVFSLFPGKIVAIDIEPGTTPSIINPLSAASVPVAILSGGEFDALQVDPGTVKFGPAEATAERYSITDVDGDGDADLLLYFRIQQTGIACFDSKAALTGKLYEGSDIVGTDPIETVGCLPNQLTSIEAESMQLTGGYYAEENAAASGGQLIRQQALSADAGGATAGFGGVAGKYDIAVTYFDENDGRSSQAFLLNGQLLDEWVADEDPTCSNCDSPGANTLRTRIVARDVRLLPGDEIALRGTRDHYEYARFDKISLSPVGFRDIEAEALTLGSGYAVEDNARASGGQLIRRLDSGGYAATASTEFAESAGSYDITVSYFDESDGSSSLAFLLNGEILDQWLADEDPVCSDCASPGASTLRSRLVAKELHLLPGDEIALQGTGEYYEYARFDKITLALVSSTTLEAEAMSLDGGFVVEANSAASGGQIIRGNRAADSIPGQASAAFMGTTGSYDITVTYFDEYDGISTLAVYLNDQLLEQWLADENPACRDCASPNERTLRRRVVATGIEISTGEEIRLESTVSNYEYGRFDKIDFARSSPP